MSLVRADKLDFWIQHGYNVLFVGKHGVGKTSIIKEAFERAGLRWRILNAATLDPWVDFIGVPREQKAADGTPYLELVRPLEFQKDEVDAIFIDEFNRGGKKVRNAVMELIQFKTVNGKPYHNLKVVWVACNPSDTDDYDTEKLDLAQEDRFQIKVNIPYEPCIDFFQRKYGEVRGRAAVAWWKDLSSKEQDVVSPRRLDYAIDVFQNGGDVRDVVPAECNCSKLLFVLKEGPVYDKLTKFLEDKSYSEAQEFLLNENSYAATEKWITDTPERLSFFVPLLADEKVSVLVAKEKKVRDFVISNCLKLDKFKHLLKNIVAANQNESLIKSIRKITRHNKELAAVLFEEAGKGEIAVPYFSEKPKPHILKTLRNINNWINWASNTEMKRRYYTNMLDYIPEKMSKAVAVSVLKIVDNIAGSSHAATLESLPNFAGVTNHCINELVGIENVKPLDILEWYAKDLLVALGKSDLLKKQVRV